MACRPGAARPALPLQRAAASRSAALGHCPPQQGSAAGAVLRLAPRRSLQPGTRLRGCLLTRAGAVAWWLRPWGTQLPWLSGQGVPGSCQGHCPPPGSASCAPGTAARGGRSPGWSWVLASLPVSQRPLGWVPWVQDWHPSQAWPSAQSTDLRAPLAWTCACLGTLGTPRPGQVPSELCPWDSIPQRLQPAAAVAGASQVPAAEGGSSRGTLRRSPAGCRVLTWRAA